MILVTGASGFIGRALCRDLVARGRATAGACRPDRRAAVPPGVERRPIGDLADEDAWRGALARTEAVVHLAGIAHVADRRAAADAAEHAHRVNAEATRRLAAAAAAAGARRLVFVSTAKVHGETSAAPWREDAPPAPSDPYAASKWAAEQALAETARGAAIEIVVLRPPLVYGPGVKANFLALLALCDTPWPLPFGSLDRNRRSLLYVGNLVAAIGRALDHPAAAGRAYLVADDGAWSTAEIAGKIRIALGRPPRLVPVAASVLRAVARLGHAQAESDRLTESFEVDAERIRRELDWRPPFSFEQGLAATAAWWRGDRI
jgi:nucleoside-diphosphate-sugar epimerase